MLSIRRTLLLNVTVLLAVALSAVGILVYGISREAVEEKRRATQTLIENQFEQRRDAELLYQARSIAAEVRSSLDRDVFHQTQETGAASFFFLMPVGPVGFPSSVDVVLSLNRPYQFNRVSNVSTKLELTESEHTQHGYVQVTSSWGKTERTEGSPTYPSINPDSPEQHYELGQQVFTNVEIHPGHKARLVTLKSPLFASRRPRDRNNQRQPTPGSGSSQPFRGPPPPNLPNPVVYVQCAWDDTTQHPKLTEFEKWRTEQLSCLDTDTDTTLHTLRMRLIWIGVAAPCVLLLAGWLLVGKVLTPLKRLSLAVSQVNEKDFRLPIDTKELPEEVNPVVSRLRDTLSQLEKAFAREKRAAADISHELRTPLAALSTTLDVALCKPRTLEENRRYLEDARGIARQMSLLVERMLLIAWIDADGDQVRKEVVPCKELVAGCAAIGRPLAESQGLQFRTSVTEPISLKTDPDKVREVLMNLLHNAIEYNKPGGEIELNAWPGTSGGAVLEVRDTGIGIAPDVQDKIFERFYRGDPSRNSAGVHAGLGLAIVKEYVTRLGGTLTVVSKVGAGSCFRIELPDL